MSGATFSQLWSTFYEQAINVAESGSSSPSDSSAPSDPQHKRRVIATLDGLVKIVFGLDTQRKAAVVSYGDGALELIVALTRSTNVFIEGRRADDDNDDGSQLLTSSFKAIKACVVRNPVGRSRLRSAGFFELTDDALSNNNNTQLVEEILTSLAAACLGDDLNALQASLQLRGYIDHAESLSAEGNAAGLKQKVAYLRALFDAVSKEQEGLIKEISDTHKDFFSDVRKSEIELKNGNKAVSKEDFEAALFHYDQALERVGPENFSTDSGLLNSLRCQLYWNRANVRFKLERAEDALDDINVLLRNEVPSDIAASVQKLKEKTLSALGRDQEAKEAAGKALVFNPQDEELREKMTDLNTS